MNLPAREVPVRNTVAAVMVPMTVEQRAMVEARLDERNRVVSSQESQRIAQTLSRVPQGTLAWDPEYAEYLRWLAEQDQQP